MSTATTYDPEADALYVRVAPEGTAIQETREVEPGVVLDLAADGRIVGIEVLGVKARIAAAPGGAARPAA